MSRVPRSLEGQRYQGKEVTLLGKLVSGTLDPDVNKNKLLYLVKEMGSFWGVKEGSFRDGVGNFSI